MGREENQGGFASRIGRKLVMWALVLAVIGIGVYAWGHLPKKERGKHEKITVVTESSLEKILQISDLSTYEAVYNGVAYIYDKEKEGQISYYAAYEAKVQVGIDMEEIQIRLEEGQKKVVVTLPETKIHDVIVDMASLDYMFVDKKADTKNVSSEAYAACIADAKEESSKNQEIIRLAKENTKDMVKALIEPLLEQQKEPYTLEVQ